MSVSKTLSRPLGRVRLVPHDKPVTARLGGEVIATSTRAILVDEVGHAPVIYFPRGDVALDRLAGMAGRVTHCPYKGDACYWSSAPTDPQPVAWSYETPFPELAAITGYIAFYPERVAVELGA